MDKVRAGLWYSLRGRGRDNSIIIDVTINRICK